MLGKPMKRYWSPRRAPTYSQRSLARSKLNQTYSKIHQQKTRKPAPSNSFDYRVVCNDSYIYQGQWLGSFRNGEGIALLKNGTTIIGHWYKDVLDGRSLIFTPFGAIISAQFVNGKLNGWAIAEYKNKLIMANMFFQDKVDGPRISFQATEELWIASDFTNDGQLIKITHVEKGKKNKLPLFVQNDQLLLLFQQITTKKNFTFDFQRIKTIEISQHNHYIGFVNKQSLPEGLGITYSQLQCFTGHYSNGFLQQFGRMIFNNGDVYQGGFRNGEFFGVGNYYVSNLNKTMITNSHSHGENQILQQKSGYYNVDFQFKIGNQIAKQDEIRLTQAMLNFLKLLQKYYYQYHIQSRKKQQINYSNCSEDQESGERIKDMEQMNQKQYVVRPVKWVYNEGQSGISEEGSVHQDVSRQFSLSKNSNFQKQFQSEDDPRRTLSPTNQFFSINIKQNQEQNQGQRFNRHDPKNINTKKQLFYKDSNLTASKSLDITELTFRGPQKNDEGRSPKSPQKLQMKDQQQIYYDFIQPSNKVQYSKVGPLLSRKSSQISNVDDKLTNIFKKMSSRRKIFQ